MKYLNFRNLVITFLVVLMLFFPMFINSFLINDSKVASEEIDFIIGVSQANLGEDWHINMNREIKEEKKKHRNLRVIYTDAMNSSDKQKRDIEKLLEYGIDLLIVSLNNSEELTPIIADVYNQIPVIVLDRAVIGYKYSLFIGPDNESIGNKAGKFILNDVGEEGGRILQIKGPSGDIPVELRSKGFSEIIEKESSLEIIDTIYGDWNKDRVEDMLLDYNFQEEKINYIFAQSDAMALGAYKALEKKGIENIKLIGVDGLDGENGGRDLVDRGILECTFTCTTGGKEAVQYAIDILEKQKGLPKKIILRSDIVQRKFIYKEEKWDESRAKISNGIEEEFKDREFFQNDINKSEFHRRRNTGRKPVLGFAQVGSESNWRKANTESIIDAAEEFGIDLRYVNVDEENKLSILERQKKQIETIRDFIEDKVDVIAFSPVVESGWDEILKDAKRAEIPVILSDRQIDSEDDLWTSFIGSDFVEEGRRAGEWVLENYSGSEAKILELRGTEGSTPANDRREGFLNIIGEKQNFKVIGSYSGDFMYQNGRDIVHRLFQDGEFDFDIIYAHNDDMILGAIEALKKHGIEPGKDIMMVSIDGTIAAFKSMIDGELNCTVECNPLLGEQLMKIVLDIKEGKKIPISIITKEGVFDKGNAKKNIKQRKY